MAVNDRGALVSISTGTYVLFTMTDIFFKTCGLKINFDSLLFNQIVMRNVKRLMQKSPVVSLVICLENGCLLIALQANLCP